MKNQECEAILENPGLTKHLGSHLILELENCSSESFKDDCKLAENFEAKVKESGATVVKSIFHHFNPIGLSGVVVIAESHVTLHTWPEHRYVAIDAFTCGDKKLLEQIKANMIELFKPASHNFKIIPRGMSRLKNNE